MSALANPLQTRTQQIIALCDLIEARNAPTELKGDIDQLCQLVQSLELCTNRREWNSLKAVIRQALTDIDPSPALPF